MFSLSLSLSLYVCVCARVCVCTCVCVKIHFQPSKAVSQMQRKNQVTKHSQILARFYMDTKA
jgi:hypothetical protein